MISATARPFGAMCQATVFLSAALPSFAFSQASNSSWVTAWTVAPDIAVPGPTGDNGLIFNQQTEREILHTTIGGTSARIHISNEYGTVPLTISDVHIAVVDPSNSDGFAIVPSTDRVITFAGSESLTVPAGGTAVSDSLTFTVPALANVAVSIFFPASNPRITNTTAHEFTAQTLSFAAGDVSGATDLPNETVIVNYYFLTGLDVQGPSLSGSLVAIGASAVAAFTSTQDANRRWTDILAQRFNAAGINVGVANMGIVGDTMLSADTGNGNGELNRFGRDVLAQPGVKYVIAADTPINDLGGNPSIPLSQFTQAYQTLSKESHAQGLKFYCATLTPFVASTEGSAEGESTREQLNAFFKSSPSICDGVFDFDMAVRDPANPTMYLPAYDSGDHLHPNDAGYQAMANAIDLTLFTSSNSVTPVDLASLFNREGIVSDGTSFPGGIDTDGCAYSANLLGASQVFGGTNLGFGSANQDNVVSTSGQTLNLPSGQFGSLFFLGTGVNGNQTPKTFTITYTDGTTSTALQSFSDWGSPQGFPGETVVSTTAHRDRSDGSIDDRPFNLYGYTLPLNPAKTVSTLTLPSNVNVEILAMALSKTLPSANIKGLGTEATSLSGERH